jgi:transcriptional regulator with XRE-family HTH domain
MERNDFSISIRNARHAKGMNQAELKEAVNVITGHKSPSNTLVSNWETGHTRPSAQIAAAIAQVLGLDEARLCAINGQISPMIQAALMDPDFASEVEALRVRRLVNGVTP